MSAEGYEHVNAAADEQKPIVDATPSKDYTYTEIAGHDTKGDLWMVVHDKVYNVGNFVDEHPGGEEVMMDVGGQDATESFEDVGHSDEAREILEKFYVGNLKRGADDPKPNVASSTKTTIDTSAGGIPTFVYIILALLVAGGAFFFSQK